MLRRLSPRMQYWLVCIVLATLTGLGFQTLGIGFSLVLLLQILTLLALRYWFKRLRKDLIESQKASMQNQQKIYKRIQNLEEQKK